MTGISTTEPFSGAKIALVTDGGVLTLLRDDLPTILFPAMWDLPGGAREGDETPDACALRELHEELGLTIAPDLISYRDCRPGAHLGGAQIWFLGAHLPAFDPDAVRMGDEGQRWALMPVPDFLAHPRAIPHLQAGLRRFLSAVPE